MVVETLLAFGPVIVRFDPGLTVASVAPLEPKLYLIVVTPAAVLAFGCNASGTEMLYDHELVPVFVYVTFAW